MQPAAGGFVGEPPRECVLRDAPRTTRATHLLVHEVSVGKNLDGPW
jgi:hypothetical protein